MRAVAYAGGVLADAAIERPGGPLALGDTVMGRIIAHRPTLAGCFVALPGGREDGFLPDSAAGAARDNLTEGRHLALVVTRDGQGGKGPRLALAALPGQEAAAGPLRLLARGPGAIARLAALHPAAAIRVDRPALAAALPPALRARATIGLGDAAEAAETAWALLAEQMVGLPGGARCTITPTPALTAIDVDAGSATEGRAAKKDAQLALNRRIIPALAGQIRLRNLAGAILLDLAGLPRKLRPALAGELQAALAADPLGPRFLGFTALGLAEIERRRTAPPLHELLTSPHGRALAGLRALQAALRGTPMAVSAGAAAGKPALALEPELLGALTADKTALADFTAETGTPPLLCSEMQRDPASAGWRLVTNM